MILKQTEELDELLDLYKIIYKSNYIDENETNKAHIYFDSELLKGEAETNINIQVKNWDKNCRQKNWAIR